MNGLHTPSANSTKSSPPTIAPRTREAKLLPRSRDSLPPQQTAQPIVAHSHPVSKSIISESRLDRDAREVREELLKRKRARDLHRRKQGEQAKDMLRRFVATGSKAN
jgi:hypothetical protein